MLGIHDFKIAEITLSECSATCVQRTLE